MVRAFSFAEIENEPTARLEQLKREIKDFAAGISLRPQIEDYRRLGEMLIKLKSLTPKNHWQEEVRSLGSPKLRECQYYMALARDPNAMRCVSMQDAMRMWRRVKKTAHEELREEERAEAVQNLLGIEGAQRIYHRDNRLFNWPTAQAIWGDPPWGVWEHYRWLAALGERVLVDGGLMFIQCGSTELHKVLPIFEGRYNIIDTMALTYPMHDHASHVVSRNWRPVILMSKGKYQRTSKMASNVYTITTRNEKSHHEWQQPEGPPTRWLQALTQPGDMVLDPFSGSGTIACVCKQIGRHCTATELIKTVMALSRKRLKETCV